MSKENDKVQDLKFDDFILSNILDGGTLEEEKNKDIDLTNELEKDKDNKDIKDQGSDIDDKIIKKDKDSKNNQDLDNPDNIILDDDNNDNPSFKPFFQVIHNSLGIEYNETEDNYEDSEEGLKDLVLDIIKANSEPDYGSEDVRKIDEYVKKGGDIKKYFSVTYNTPDFDKMDTSKPEDQKKIVYEFFKRTTKLSDEKIEAKIARFSDLEALEEEAKDALDELKKISIEEKENLTKDLERRNREFEQEKERRLSELKSTIMDSNDFDGLPISKTDKEKFYEYLTKVDKEGLTQYQKELKQDTKASIKMAYLKFKNFKLDNIEAKTKTEITKELKKNLSRFSAAASKGTNSPDPSRNNNKKEDTKYEDFSLKNILNNQNKK